MNEENTNKNESQEDVEKNELEKEPTMCDCGECAECIEETGSCNCGDCDICAKNEEVDPINGVETEDLYDDVNPEDLI